MCHATGINSSLLTPGCKNQFNGKGPERHGRGAANAEVQWTPELRGASGGDEADGGLPQPHQVYEEQGLTQHEMEFSLTELLLFLVGWSIKSYIEEDTDFSLLSFMSIPPFLFPPYPHCFQMEQVKQDLSRKDTELLGLQTKLETLTNQFSDSKQHIEVLKESLTAKEQRAAILQTEVQQIHIYTLLPLGLWKRFKVRGGGDLFLLFWTGSITNNRTELARLSFPGEGSLLCPDVSSMFALLKEFIWVVFLRTNRGSTERGCGTLYRL